MKTYTCDVCKFGIHDQVSTLGIFAQGVPFEVSIGPYPITFHIQATRCNFNTTDVHICRLCMLIAVKGAVSKIE